MLAIQFGLQVGGCSGQLCQGLTGRAIGQLAGDLLLQLEMFLCLLLPSLCLLLQFDRWIGQIIAWCCSGGGKRCWR